MDRGVGQRPTERESLGDSSLAIQSLENDFKKTPMWNPEIKIDATYHHYLHFTNDIVLISDDFNEIKLMLQEQNNVTKTRGIRKEPHKILRQKKSVWRPQDINCQEV